MLGVPCNRGLALGLGFLMCSTGQGSHGMGWLVQDVKGRQLPPRLCPQRLRLVPSLLFLLSRGVHPDRHRCPRP